jgi:hypothetical protein
MGSKRIKRQKANIIILSLVLLVLLCIYGALAAESGREARKTAASLTLFDVKSSDLTSVEIKNGDDETKLKKENGKWSLADSDAPLDNDKVTKLLKQLAPLKAQTLVNSKTDSSSLDDYGLNSPEISISISSGDKSVNVSLGNYDKKSGVYVMDEKDRNKVFLFSKEFYTAADIRSNDLIQVEAFPKMYMENGLSIVVKKDGKEVVHAERDTSEESEYSRYRGWHMVVPYEGYAGSWQNIRAYFAKFNYMKFSKCWDYSPSEDDLKKYGLDVPEYEADLKYTDDDGKEYHIDLLVGKEASKGNYYAKNADSDPVWILPDTFIKSFMDIEPSISAADIFLTTDLSKDQKFILRDGNESIEYTFDRTEKDNAVIPTPNPNVVVIETPDPGQYEYDFNVSCDGKDIDGKKFIDTYQKIKDIKAVGEIDDSKIEGPDETIYSMSVTDDNGSTHTADFLNYDGVNFYRVRVDGKMFFLANKPDVDSLARELEGFIGS